MSVKLFVQIEPDRAAKAESLPANLVDAVCGPEDSPADALRIQNWKDLEKALSSVPTTSGSIILDGRFLGEWMPRLIVGLSALLVDWEGEELRLLASKEEDLSYLLRPLADLLRVLQKRAKGVRIISCRTCARRHTDVISLAREIDRELEHISEPLDVAVMGCEVNGPGEARAADVGIAFGKDVALIFRKGSIIERVPGPEARDALLKEIALLTG